MLGYSGNASYGSDTVTLGWPGSNPPSAPKLIVAEFATKEFYMGVLGLNPWPVNFTELDNSHPSLLSALKNQRNIPSLTWSYTAGAYNYKPPVFGSLTLGGYDASRFVSNHLNFSMGADISRDLLVAVQSITMAGSQLLSSPIYAYIDSLVPFLWLPIDACKEFEIAFGLTWNDTAQLYLIDDKLHQDLLDQNQSVTFNIGPSSQGDSVSIEMPYWSFMLNASYPLVSGSASYFPLRRAANETQYTLGRAFLQNAYVIANYEYFNFSVFPAKYPDTNVPQEIITLCPREGCPSSSHGFSTSIIAGIAIGSFAALAITILVIWRTRRRLSNRASHVIGGNQIKRTTVGFENSGLISTAEETNKFWASKNTHELAALEKSGSIFELDTSLKGANSVFELPSNEIPASEMHTPSSTAFPSGER
jgi:hypothetical protein